MVGFVGGQFADFFQQSVHIGTGGSCRAAEAAEGKAVENIAGLRLREVNPFIILGVVVDSHTGTNACCCTAVRRVDIEHRIIELSDRYFQQHPFKMGIQVELDGTVVHADKVALCARLRFSVKVLGRSLGDDVVHTCDLDIVGVLHIAADGEVVDAATGTVEVSQLDGIFHVTVVYGGLFGRRISRAAVMSFDNDVCAPIGRILERLVGCALALLTHLDIRKVGVFRLLHVFRHIELEAVRSVVRKSQVLKVGEAVVARILQNAGLGAFASFPAWALHER